MWSKNIGVITCCWIGLWLSCLMKVTAVPAFYKEDVDIAEGDTPASWGDEQNPITEMQNRLANWVDNKFVLSEASDTIDDVNDEDVESADDEADSDRGSLVAVKRTTPSIAAINALMPTMVQRRTGPTVTANWEGRKQPAKERVLKLLRKATRGPSPKRSVYCMRKCMAQGLLHPAQCHSLC